jgi:hypothetical protein
MSLSLLPLATIWLALFTAAALAWLRPLHGTSVAVAGFGYALALAFGKLAPIALAPSRCWPPPRGVSRRAGRSPCGSPRTSCSRRSRSR